MTGFATVADAHWAVIVQQPRAEALAPLGDLTQEMFVEVFPVAMNGLALMLLGGMLIARPLHQLARHAMDLSAPDTTFHLHRINTWYAESAIIRQALILGVQQLQQRLGSLSQAADSDPLTGLANRRAMNTALSALDETGCPYSALALDIDRFKSVNDTFGHDVGDEALRHIARLIVSGSRAGDLACRAGGEEFWMLLPNTDLQTAQEIAERIRVSICSTPVDPVGALTISIGVACRGSETPNSRSILKQADERLYKAKDTGRNRVVAS